MKHFYLYLILPFLLLGCLEKEPPTPPVVGTGNPTFLNNDSRYDSVYVRKDYVDFKGSGLLSGYLNYARDNEVAIVYKTGSYDPQSAGALRLEYITDNSRVKLGKAIEEPTVAASNQSMGRYYFFPPDSTVYYAGFTTGTERPVAYAGKFTSLVNTNANNGRAVVGPNRQTAVIAPRDISFFNEAQFVEKYPVVNNSVFFFDRSGTANKHKAYQISFDKAAKTIVVDSMAPGLPPPAVPGQPKDAIRIITQPAGISDSVVYYFLNAQQFENNFYVISLNWIDVNGTKFMNIYTYDMNADFPNNPYFVTKKANVPMGSILPKQYYFQGPEDLEFHFLKEGDLFLARNKNVGNGKDILKLNGSSFEDYNPFIREGAQIYSAKSSENYLWLTLGNGTTRVELIRTKK